MEYTINILNQNYKLLQYCSNRVVAINCFPFDGEMDKNEDIIIIKWNNGIIHYFIEKNNIFYQYVFGDFDLTYYKTQTNDTIYWDNCFKHWLLIGRKNNFSYINYWKDTLVTYINLKEREDRNNQIIELLEKNEINNYVRFDGIKKKLNEIIGDIDVNNLWNINGQPPKINNEEDINYIIGVYGCYKSHLTIMEDFLKESEKQYLLILEDDYYIETQIKQKINESINYFETNNVIFNMLYLSIALYEQNENVKTYSKINKNLLKIKNGFGSTTHAILYNKNTIKHVIDFLKTGLIIELDKKLKNMDDRYCIYPMLGYQIPDVSNIGSYRENILIKNGIVDYGKINEMYNFDNELIEKDYLIYVENIETPIFQKMYNELKNKYGLSNKIDINKKYIIFGKINENIQNSIIITNDENVFVENNYYITDNLSKYNNKKNIFYVNEKNIKTLLCSINIYNIYEIDIKLNKDDINVINLSYSVGRYGKFKKNNKMKNINFIPAIKYNPLFLGCVLSNKMIISNAIKQNIDYIQICEDDVIINDYNIITQAIKYLRENAKWDLLSCFIVNIDTSYKIEKIIKLNEKYKLIKLNNWCSTVFNIYHKNSYSKFMEYNENEVIENKYDENGNLEWSIDRKIKFEDVYLIYPYPVDIMNVNSEIWEIENIYDKYINMKKKSYELLDKMCKNYFLTHS